MNSVDRKSDGTVCSLRQRLIEQIHELHAVGLGDLTHRLRIHLEPGVRGGDDLFAGQVGIVDELVGDGGEQHEPGSRLAVVLLLERVLDEGGDVLLERVQPRLAGERFVVAVEGEDHVRLGIGQLEAVLANLVEILLRQLGRLRTGSHPAQPLIMRPKRHRPQPMIRILPPINLIAGITEIAEHQIVLREPRVNQRLQPPKVLHPLRQRIADNANVVPLVEREFLRVRHRSDESDCGQQGPEMRFHGSVLWSAACQHRFLCGPAAFLSFVFLSESQCDCAWTQCGTGRSRLCIAFSK